MVYQRTPTDRTHLQQSCDIYLDSRPNFSRNLR
jgi:hypothetical protein